MVNDKQALSAKERLPITPLSIAIQLTSSDYSPNEFDPKSAISYCVHQLMRKHHPGALNASAISREDVIQAEQEVQVTAENEASLRKRPHLQVFVRNSDDAKEFENVPANVESDDLTPV